jgi:hypothetical protein
MPSSSSSDSSSEPDQAEPGVDDAELEEVFTSNEGASTDEDLETPSHASLRGQAALVTASCLRRYPRTYEARHAQRMMIPDDFTKEDFLKNFRRVFDTHSTQRIEKATCHDEPHRRFRPSADRRERHKHIAMKASGTFAHKKIADAFYQQFGIRISFSFKLNRFVGYLKYLMEPGEKPSTDLDLAPAVYPASLNLQAELAVTDHPQAQQEQVRAHRKRKRLTFDEVSNVIIEGIGSGPLRTPDMLEQAARTLKQEGKTELWNYMGDLRTPGDVRGLLARVWRLQGTLVHPLWHKCARFDLGHFAHQTLDCVAEWLAGKHRSHVLVLSGDGGLGKTSLAEALIQTVSPEGFWFLDDPDDFREIDGLLVEGHGLVVDEVQLANVHPNQIKKMFDLEKTRRINCRHFNGTLPKGCPRIFITNSDSRSFYPSMSLHDQTGVMRRQLFQVVSRDVRKITEHHRPERASQERADMKSKDESTELLFPSVGPSAAEHGESRQQAETDFKDDPTELLPCGTGPSAAGPWKNGLREVCGQAQISHLTSRLEEACFELGVAKWSEIVEFGSDLAAQVGMKPLERRRWLAAIRP